MDLFILQIIIKQHYITLGSNKGEKFTQLFEQKELNTKNYYILLQRMNVIRNKVLIVITEREFYKIYN